MHYCTVIRRSPSLMRRLSSFLALPCPAIRTTREPQDSMPALSLTTGSRRSSLTIEISSSSWIRWTSMRQTLLYLLRISRMSSRRSRQSLRRTATTSLSFIQSLLISTAVSTALPSLLHRISWLSSMRRCLRWMTQECL